jgi:hypothetical protein
VLLARLNRGLARRNGVWDLPIVQHRRIDQMADSRPECKRVPVKRDVLDQARSILGTSTDEETVHQALDLLVFRHEVADGIRRISGSNSIRDIYAED